jgi:hypothetical protein
MNPLWQRWLLFLGTAVLWLVGCDSGLMPHIVTHPMQLSAPDGWHDGAYTGTSDRVGEPPTPQLVRVTMDVSRGRIVTVRVHQPPGWKAPQEEDLLLRQVLEQSPTGLEPPAAGSSEADQLRRALDDAITKARAFSPATP